MPLRLKPVFSAIAAAILAAHCSFLERSNPADPAAESAASQTQTLTLLVPVPKPLVSVLDSMVAILEGPDMTTIEKEVTHSPLGPGLLTIGAISPGSERTLTIRGFDHDGRLVMEGVKRNITVTEGDTVQVTVNLTLAEGFSQDADSTGAASGGSGEPGPVTSTGDTAEPAPVTSTGETPGESGG